MKIYKLILITFFLGFSYTGWAQEGLAPLWGNEFLQVQQIQKTGSRGANKVDYHFIIDTNHLPILDDFSKNYFKVYDWDTATVVLDTQVWVKFLVNGLYEPKLDAMFDTSYTYPPNGNGGYDSIANPVLYVVHYSLGVYELPVDTDTVWVRPDTIFAGNTIVTNHDPDITYFNSLDSIVIVPDIGFSLWTTQGALHNYTYGDDAPTIGVVTFDGLDSNGTPYDPTMNPNSYQLADILESKPIYLKTRPGGGNDYNFTQDTAIWLSFFYQPQGLGDAPEFGDSLILQFYSPINKMWTTQWKHEGVPLEPFRFVSVNIRSSLYFQNGFKFRFLNYASVSGNFDHWNIDYVRLDELRTEFDSTMNDAALMDQGSSLLINYSQMPWLHYKASTSNLMKTEQDIRFRNLHSVAKLAETSFEVTEDGIPIFDGSLVTTPNLPPFAVQTNTSTVQGVYPTTNTDTTHSFHVIYDVTNSPDDNIDNNTYDFHQQFGTQYAYDDGSAESAYFVTSSGASIAVEYDLATTDSLRAVNIYFPKSFENILDRSYRLMVWESLDPEVVLHESYLNFPLYSNGRDVVRGIQLEEPLEVSGKIFIGIKQTDSRVFIGLDKNNDNQFKNYYRINGVWSNSSYKGSLFIRPEFGTTTQWPVSVNEVTTDEFDFNVYPNPSNSMVNVALHGFDNTVIVRNMLGVQVRTFFASGTLTFDVSDLPTGMYLIDVTDNETGDSKIKRLLIQH